MTVRLARRESTAYHEAGHAVAAYLWRQPFRRVSVEADAASLGHVLFDEWSGAFRPDVDDDRRTIRRVEARIFTAVAGNVAQWIATRRNDRVGARADFDHARRMAGYIAGDPDEADALVAYLRARSRNTLAHASNWAAIKSVANALIERGSLAGRDARRIIKAALESEADDWPLAD